MFWPSLSEIPSGGTKQLAILRKGRSKQGERRFSVVFRAGIPATHYRIVVLDGVV